MRIGTLVAALEAWAPRSLQEDYDNSGLQVGDPNAEVERALIALDATEEVVEEAAAQGAGLLIVHHPLLFKGLRSLTGRDGVERTLLAAIRHKVAIYAIHTNLDNVLDGVNGEIASRLGLEGLRVLQPKNDQLRKLVTFVPEAHLDTVRDAVFAAGAGRIGQYDQCGYTLQGLGSFRPGAPATPFVGRKGELHSEPEVRFEAVYGASQQAAVVDALRAAHPYEEPAFDLLPLANTHPEVGSGAIGTLPEPLSEEAFIAKVKAVFGAPVVRHTALRGKPVRTVAVCGGSGAFLIGRAMAAGADVYLTADVKYHEFFTPDGRILLTDIGHFESERFTMDLIQRRLGEIFPTFATRLTELVTNPIHCS